MAAHNHHTPAAGGLRAYPAAALFLSAALSAGAALPAQVRLPVPFVRQKRDWCGPAALAMVLTFHGAQVSQHDIAAHMPTVRPGGVLNLDLKLYARSLGFKAESRSGTLDDLKQELAARRPVICTIRLKQGLHYLPVVGYDESKQVLLAHLRRPFAAISFRSFDNQWKASGRWMLSITPPDPGRASPAAPTS